MTTNQQRRLYFPAWNACLAACWVKDRGQLLPRPGRQESENLTAVEIFAKRVAKARSGTVSADDLRHASHLVALGKTVSSSDLTNIELDRVLVLWRLLVDPDDLSAVVAWDHPEQQARTRLEWSVRHCGLPEAYVLHVCSSKFGTREWQNLDDQKLRQLVITLKSRATAKNGKAN